VWELLAEIEPTNKLFKLASRNPELYCLELDKAAYGLKDAPLLWNLKAVLVLVSDLAYIRSSHDSCLFYRVKDGKVVVIISLHVDDTLATGEKWALEELHKDLEKHFGTMKAEKNKFRHFGVDISRNEETLDVQMCQKSYIANLKPISRKKEKGRTVECDSNPQEVTDFRSLVSGIAWVGITSPGAQAVASLMQGFLPIPKLKHLDMANAALQQLIDEYVPLVFRFGFDLSSSKLLLQTDSSLGNNQKYSQGGFVLFLCENDPQKLAGHVNLIGFRSGKSKRVANSTSAAETLAMNAGLETALHIQTWLAELQNPLLTPKQMTTLPSNEMLPIDACTDCNDVYSNLMNPAQPNLVNLSMTLHMSALRAERECKRVRAWIWLDTNDMLANPLTKLNVDGTLPQEDLVECLKTGWWAPRKPYKYEGQLTAETKSDSHAKL
jgi:hypothetical protein